MTARVLVAGETLIDFIPDRPGSLGEVETFDRRAGGAPANVAVGLARLGEPPYFWTRLATDPFGEFLEDRLTAAGIPDRFIERDPDAQTALAFVTHDADADRAFTFYRDETADTQMQLGTVPDRVLDTVEWVHVGGVALSAEPTRTATFDLVERARVAGCTVSFDPNTRPELWDDPSEREAVTADALADADVVKTSEDDLTSEGELTELDASSPKALARSIHERGPSIVFVTRGEEGALVSAELNGSEDSHPPSADPTVRRHSGFDVETVDTTGAGDAFLAGAISALLDVGDQPYNDRSLDDVLAFATAVAAISTTASGAIEALPRRDAVERMIDEQ